MDSLSEEKKPMRLIRIGYISGVRGLRGEVKALPLSDYPERYSSLKHIYVETNPAAKLYQLERIYLQGKSLIIKFSGVDSPKAAEELCKHYVSVQEKDVFPLPADTWYEFQLIDLAVIDEMGNDLGKVKSILQTGSNAVLVVARSQGGEMLLPMLREVVLSVDLNKQIIAVRVPPGLDDGK